MTNSTLSSCDVSLIFSHKKIENSGFLLRWILSVDKGTLQKRMTKMSKRNTFRGRRFISASCLRHITGQGSSRHCGWGAERRNEKKGPRVRSSTHGYSPSVNILSIGHLLGSFQPSRGQHQLKTRCLTRESVGNNLTLYHNASEKQRNLHCV